MSWNCRKDMQVNMKKQYNNQNKSLLSGDQWYCYQAFRALNQAVGRCIRHRHDYGAIILLDERYKRASNLEYMSKWLRSSIQQVETLENSLKGLQSFFKKFQDTSSQVVSSLKMPVASDPEENRGSSNPIITKAAATAPAKQSRKVSLSDDKENAVCLSNQAAVTAIAKNRLTKNGLMGLTNQKQLPPEANNHTVRTLEVQSTKMECDQGPVSKKDRSPLQEIQAHTRADFNDGTAPSGSVITLADSPPVTARCYSPRCFFNGVSVDSSAQNGIVEAEEHRTPLISTISNRSEVCASSLVDMSINSHETSMSTWKTHGLVTPCNLFKENKGNIHALSAKPPENVPFTDPFVRSLTTDFMACNEAIPGDENNCEALRGNDRLAASKKTLNPFEVPTSDIQGAGIETSILCLKCGASLLGAMVHSKWRKVRMKKKYLNRLINPDEEVQLHEHTDVLVLELSLLHPFIYGGTSDGGIWVEEDGCVFKPLCCPGCNLKECIGAYVLAADRSNMKLVDKALLLCDAVDVIGEKGGGCIGGTQWCDDVATEESCQVMPSNSFAKRAHQTQTPPRPKLKLPRRD